MPSCFRIFAYHDLQRVLGAGTLPLLVITALIFFVANTVPVAVIISLTEGKAAAQGLGGMPFLVVPVLHGRRGAWCSRLASSANM